MLEADALVASKAPNATTLWDQVVLRRVDRADSIEHALQVANELRESDARASVAARFRQQALDRANSLYVAGDLQRLKDLAGSAYPMMYPEAEGIEARSRLLEFDGALHDHRYNDAAAIAKGIVGVAGKLRPPPEADILATEFGVLAKDLACAANKRCRGWSAAARRCRKASSRLSDVLGAQWKSGAAIPGPARAAASPPAAGIGDDGGTSSDVR
jgi:hypothetical protein